MHFSAYEYFQWELQGTRWVRKRPMEELLGFFETLMNLEGSLTNEAVHLDPETIELLGSRRDTDDDPRRVRLFGFTKEISLLQTQVEVAIGKSLPRPKIPGLELRVQRNIARTNNAVSRAQERAAARKARALRERNARLNASKGT